MPSAPTQIRSPQTGQSKLLGTSATSPIDNTKRKIISVHVRKGVQILYIGGAGDKKAYPGWLPLPRAVVGPFNNVLAVKKYLDVELGALKLKEFQAGHYLGYYETYRDERIRENVVPFLKDKATPLILIGHSLGGWNGAQLSYWLNDAGYNVEMLVTLDPVGRGDLVGFTSDIYVRTPHVATKFWINIRAEASDTDFSDRVADFGEQWLIKEGPHINAQVDVNHWDARGMFTAKLPGGGSAATHVLDLIKRLTK